MKLTRNTKRASGMTLLELTVVILVLLSLISILFIGARAWKRGSDRAASILTIRNVQQGVRSFANMNGHNPGDTVTTLKADVIGAGKFIENDPTVTGSHPAQGFNFVIDAPTIIPAVGALYINTQGTGTTNDADPDYYNPAAADITDW